MEIIRDLTEAQRLPRATALTIGNFDGVHLAHAQLIEKVVRAASRLGAASGVLTFEPHPARILRPNATPRLLTPLEQKVELIERAGPDFLVILRFTRELSELSAEAFVGEILAEKLHARAIVVGDNFRFGHGKAGDVEVLAALGRARGFDVQISPMLEVRGERVSSSRIRELLAEGRVEKAGRLLGRFYSLRGPIVRGRGVGARQVVPTLNLVPVDEQIPQNGVYITRTSVGDRAHPSVTNVGVKPTFGDQPLTVESHLLDATGEIPSGEIEIQFLRRLRTEMRFPTPGHLKNQIARDVHRAQQFFRLLQFLTTRKGR